jgi:hypothetical protein
MAEVRPLAPEGVDALDDRVRTRLAEIRASAGVPHSQLSLDVLYYLPKAFLQQYADMFTKAVKADGGESGRNTSQQEQGDLGKATGRGAKTTGKRYKKTFVVLDERALQLKSVIDKRLRMVARDIEVQLAGGEMEKAASRCGQCGTFIQNRWKFCPLDGSNLSTD